MNVVSVDMFVQAINTLWFAFFLGAVIAVWLGSFLAKLSWNGVFLFLRRSRRFRRFDRAMVRRDEQARRQHFAVVLTLRKDQARNLLRADGLRDDISPELWDSLVRQCARWGVS